MWLPGIAARPSPRSRAEGRAILGRNAGHRGCCQPLMLIVARQQPPAAQTVARAENAGGVAARQLAAVEHGFKDIAGPGRQRVDARLLFRPQENARAETVGLGEPFHETDLVETGFEEEFR